MQKFAFLPDRFMLFAVSTPAKSKPDAGVRYILIAVTLVAVAIVIWRLSPVIIIAFGGIIVATLLRALAHPLRRFRRLTDHGRVGIALAILVLVLGGVAWLFGRQVGLEVGELRRLLPQQIGRLAAWLDASAVGRTLVNSLREGARDSKTFGGIGLVAVTVFGGTLDVILILFLGVYLALDPKVYLEGALHLIPVRRRAEVRHAMIEAGDALCKWLLAQFVAMAIIGVMVGGALSTIGVPLALVLGGLAALLEFIPVVGAILFGIPGILVAFSKGPDLALYTMITYLVIQQLESNIVVPLLQRWAVQMPPVVGLLAVVVAGLLLGPGGVIFAAPMAIVTLALVRHLYVEDVLEHPPKL
jgi:predicted PurR-regulated permease PerM